MEKVKTTIIGAGHIGKKHADVLSRLSDSVEIISIADVDQNRGNDLARSAKAKYYPDYKDVFRDKPDLAVICVPHSLHKEVGIATAQAGVSMLMEKPISNTLNDTVEIIEEVKKNKVRMALSFVHRYRTELQYAKRLIDDGSLGKLFTASDVFTINGGQHVPRWVWKKELSGGGIMMYSGIHSIDWLCWLMGSRVESLVANGGAFDNSADDEAYASALLTFENGTTASLIGRQPPYAIQQRTRDTEIIGDKGRIRLRCGESLEYSSERTAYSVDVKADDPFYWQACELIQMVKENREPWINYRDGLRAQSILSAMYESIETGKKVDVVYPEI